jgi:cytochrome c oxidase cbb3-type subunit 4
MIAGLVTAILLLAFLGIAAWAWSARNRARFAEAAQLPLADEPRSCCCRERCP